MGLVCPYSYSYAHTFSCWLLMPEWAMTTCHYLAISLRPWINHTYVLIHSTSPLSFSFFIILFYSQSFHITHFFSFVNVAIKRAKGPPATSGHLVSQVCATSHLLTLLYVTTSLALSSLNSLNNTFTVMPMPIPLTPSPQTQARAIFLGCHHPCMSALWTCSHMLQHPLTCPMPSPHH